MKTTKQIGDAGEDQATSLLLKEGYTIVARNFRTRFGEIDIIAKDGKTLVFIEVKKKNSDYFGSAAEMITKRKLLKVINIAKVYAQEKDYSGPWRVDAVLINKNSIELVKNLTSNSEEPVG